MRRMYQIAVAGLVLASFALMSTPAAMAAGNWELTVSPVYFLDTTGDSTTNPPPGYIPLQCPNNSQFGGTPLAGLSQCQGTPGKTSNLRLDYGLTYTFNKKWNVNYSHSNFDFSLGRIYSLAPGTSLLSGSVNDRTDQFTVNYNYGHGIALDAYYYSHQRISINGVSNPQGACFFNSEQCPGNISNPASINANAYGVGGTYSFGPHLPYEPPMFKLGLDAQYVPRPGNGNCGTATAQPACGSNGINGYVGSGWIIPYSITWFPLSTAHLPPGLIPFIGYQSLPVWFHAENSPEVYNVTDLGLIQILPHGFELSYVYFKLQGRTSSDTIPPPDVVRSVTSIFKLTYNLKF